MKQETTYFIITKNGVVWCNYKMWKFWNKYGYNGSLIQKKFY